MFSFFRKKKEGKIRPVIQMADLNRNPLNEGDIVESLRYGLGKCKIVKKEEGFAYESLKTGQQVSYLKMVDASTELQKVKKVYNSG